MVREIGWTHNLVVLEKCKDELSREFYIRMARKFGWTQSRIIGINSDNIDVVELNHCSWLIAHFVARDGILLNEKDPHGFHLNSSTSLRPDLEMKKFRKEQRQLLELELKTWKIEIM